MSKRKLREISGIAQGRAAGRERGWSENPLFLLQVWCPFFYVQYPKDPGNPVSHTEADWLEGEH